MTIAKRNGLLLNPQRMSNQTKTRSEFFVVICNERKSLFVMPAGDYPNRSSYFTKKGTGRFLGGGWVTVPGRTHKARLFASDGGGEYYVFSDYSILAKQPK